MKRWPDACYLCRRVVCRDALYIVYADYRMGLPSYSEWMIPGTQIEEA